MSIVCDLEMWNFMGASVRGPGHKQDGRPNQDALLSRQGRRYSLAVVCDGLGSRPHSADGSHAACRAVADAVRSWDKSPDATPELLLRLIHALWNIRVHTLGRNECATTCLFAVVMNDGRILLAQLGDGLVILKTEAGLTTLEPSEERFGNTTTGLGIANDLRDWRFHLAPRVLGQTTIFLATDGVTDDILPEKRQSFLDFLVTNYGSLPPHTRTRAIARTLHEWPTARHSDDKTVAVLWNTNNSNMMETTT